MAENITIAPMTRDDVPEVAVLEQLSFATPWSESGLVAEVNKSGAVFLTARDAAGMLCGYAGLNTVLDEGYIANIAVHPGCRRRGIAEALLQALLERGRAMGLAFLTLEVRPSNTPATALYSKLGFINAGLRRGFYDHPQEDGVIMTKYFVAKGAKQMRIEAVIFDMDGLMVDTEKLYYKASMAVVADMGFTPSNELILSTMGLPNTTWCQRYREYYGESFSLDTFRQECDTTMLRYYEVGVPVKPGLVELLDYLKAKKIPKAVASSTYTERATFCLSQAGVLDCMDQLVFGDMITNGKPAPDIFLEAARRLGVPPQQCMGLEDSHNGIRACHAGGLYTVMVPDMVPVTPEILTLTNGCVPSLAEVIPLIERLNSK